MGLDNRGVVRGGCSISGCSCSDFMALTSRFVCKTCHHPPAKHVSESQPVPPPYPPPAAQGWRSRGYSTSGVSHHSHSYPQAMVQQTHHIQSHTVCHQCRNPCTVLVDGLRCERCAQPCKREGCSNPRYYDPELGPFKYCSPQCKNEHYLPRYERKLKDSLGQPKGRHVLDDTLQSSSSSTLRRSSSQSSIASLTLHPSMPSHSPQTPQMYSPQIHRRQQSKPLWH